MKFRHDILQPGLVLCFVFLTALGALAQPSWVTGYPQIISGASSADINVQIDSTGTIYYAIYSSVQSAMTSAQLKNDALFGGNPNLVRRGSAAITSNTLLTINEATLTSNTTYHIYVVAESNGGLMSNNKISYTSRFFPKRQQEFYNFTNAFMGAHLLYFPENYYKDNNKYPLLLFLGGSGEMSNGGAPNPDLLLATGLPEVINNGKEIPMVVASPQGFYSWVNSQVGVDAFIEFLKANYRIDPSQIFLTGLSSGGQGVFQYTNTYPTKVKAIVPISTWPSPADPHNFLNVPVWAFMGDADTNAELVNWINALKAIGGNATYTGYPGAHEEIVWNTVYDGSRGDDIYTWLLSQNGPPNIPPQVNAGADQSVNLPLSQLQLTGTASDADGTITSYLWTEISGPTVTMTNANTSTLTLTNITSGTYIFQLNVQDNSGGTAADQVTIGVGAGGAVSREFDVNVTWAWNKQGGTIWNDFVTTGGGVVGNSTTLFDNSHTSSPITLSIIAPFQDGVNNHGVIPGLYPNNVMQYYLRSTQTKVGALKLSGLNVNYAYDLSILSSNVDVWYPSDTRLTVAGQSVTINAKGNANQLANFPSIAPNANGEITITVAPATTNSANVGVINALVIKERPPLGNNVAPVVNAGADHQVTLPLSQLQLDGTATDADGTIASLLWTKVSGQAVTMTNTTTSTLTLTNILAGTYVFQLSAQDNGGAVTNDQVTVIVNPAVIVGAREFDVNVTWAWNKQGTPWNDFVTTNGGIVGNSTVLFDKNNITSPITLSITAPFQDGVNNHGVIPGLYPNNVMQYYLRSTQTKVGALKLAGLNIAKQYDLSILSSNIDVWYPSDTRLTVQGQAATVNARSNANQLVNYTNISPTAIGEIAITVAPATTNSTNVGVINAMILTEHDAISNPGGRTTQVVTITGDETPSPSISDYVNVFPNPVEDYVNVEINSSLLTAETFSIEFVDIRGAQVYSRQVESQDGTNHVAERISADFMQSGLYIMAVRSQQKGVQYFKVLKK